MIANRVQEEAFGTLDRATLKLLDGLARRDGSRPAERNLKVGTVLVRDGVTAMSASGTRGSTVTMPDATGIVVCAGSRGLFEPGSEWTAPR
jgi:hypothetical protein